MIVEFSKSITVAGRRLKLAAIGSQANRIRILSSLLFLNVACLGPSTGMAIESKPVFTTIGAVKQAVEQTQSALCDVHLKGDVLWANAEHDQFILQDGTGGIRVTWELQAMPELQVGDQIWLNGTGAIDADGLHETLIDNDGVHPAIERSATVYMNSGYHSIRVDWFNAAQEFDLMVSYQGPQGARQAIPDSELNRVVTGPNGIRQWTNGLNFSGYEGNWLRLPYFDELTNCKMGATSNFDLAVRSRDTNVGIKFEGELQISQPGAYTFWVRSDDGGRLYLDHSKFTIQTTGERHLPAAQPIYSEQPLAGNKDCIWSVTEGTVGFAAERSGALDLVVNTGTGAISVHIASAGAGYAKLLLNSRIRITGISQSTFNGEGQRIGGALLVPSPRQIEIIEPSALFADSYPVMPIQSLSKKNTVNSLVHLHGRISRTAAGESVALRDAPGEIFLKTDPRTFDSGENKEADVIVNCGINPPTNTWLTDYVRVLPRESRSESAALPLLTEIEQIKSLPRDEAAKGYPVKMRGIVTAPTYGGFFIQDGQWAIYVRWNGLNLLDTPKSGDFWEVEGTTYVEFSPNVQASHAVRLGAGVMPEPIRPTPDQLVNGSLDTRYVELQGVVTATGSNTLEMLSPLGRLEVQLSDIDPALGAVPETNLKQYENALVRIRGCAIPARDYNTQEVESGNFWMWLCNYSIAVDQPAPRDLFSAPLKSVSDLRLFNPHASILERVKVLGQVLHQRGNMLFVWDGTNTLRVVPEGRADYRPGELIEAVGFPDLGGSSVVLREASIRRREWAELPKPRELANDFLFDKELDGELVEVQAWLTDVSTEGPDRILMLQDGTRGFIARLAEKTPVQRDILPGSKLRLTGVYVGQGSQTSGTNDNDAFELLLNSPQDIVVIERPDWWTLRRLMAALGVIILVLAGSLLWIFTLKRQVNAQALMIRRKAQREATLEERTRIARDIHDTLEQALAGTSLQLNALADSMPEAPPEPVRILQVARSMVHHAQDEARRTVRNLRFLELEKRNLPAALSELAAQSGGDSPLKIRFNLQGVYQSVPSQVESHLLRIGQEAVTNVIKHASAKNVQIELICGDGLLELTIEDDGSGFNTEQMVAAATGHFGLLGMRERAEKIGGTLTVRSAPGKGTRIRVRVSVPGSIAGLSPSNESPSKRPKDE